ncbi:hypothetical protein J6590_102879 [Homalodisca vitripennis]|nr:hypothetical protein J6590_102879 [Homalodisca vitripennis]
MGPYYTPWFIHRVVFARFGINVITPATPVRSDSNLQLSRTKCSDKVKRRALYRSAILLGLELLIDSLGKTISCGQTIRNFSTDIKMMKAKAGLLLDK